MASNGNLAAALFVHMDFRVDPRRWWNGEGSIRVGGHRWQGVGDNIEISGIGSSAGTAAVQAAFRFKGLDSGLMKIVHQGSDYITGRRVTVFLQFFRIEPENGKQAWSTKGELIPLLFAEMYGIEYSGSGPEEREVNITTRSVWERRNSPAYGFLTDVDQKARFADDIGLEEVAGLVNKPVNFPA